MEVARSGGSGLVCRMHVWGYVAVREALSVPNAVMLAGFGV